MYKVLIAIGIIYCSSIQISISEPHSASKDNFNTPDSLRALKYNGKADSLFRINYDSAVLYYEKAASIYQQLLNFDKKEKWAEKLVLSLIVQAFAYKELDQFEEALALSKKALPIALENFGEDHLITGNVYDSFGHAYYGKGAYDIALKFYQRALGIRRKKLGENHSSIAHTNNSLGAVALAKGDIKLAERYFKIALDKWKHNSGESNIKIATAYNNLGLIYFEYGAFEKAMEFLKKSIRMRENVLGKEHRLLIDPYRNMGIIYAQIEDFESALFYYLKAKKLIMEFYKNDNSKLAKIYQHIGEAYMKRNEVSQSISYLHEALQIKRNVLDENHPLLASTYYSLGRIYELQKDYEKSITYFRKALHIDSNTYDKHQNIAKYYIGISNVLIKQGKFREASRALDKALCANIVGEFTNDIYYYGVFSNNYYSLDILLESLHSKANLLLSDSTLSKKRKGLYTFLIADSVISYISGRLLKQKDLLTLSKRVNSFYKDALHQVYNAMNLPGFEKDSTDILNHSLDQLAFHFNERGKSAILFKELRTAQVKYSIGISDSLISREQNLKSRRAFFLQKIGENPNKEGYYHDLLFLINQEYDSLLTYFQHKHPNYFNLIHNTDIISIDETSMLLPDNTNIIEYFYTDSVIYTIVITNDDVVAKKIPIIDSFLKSVELMNKGIQVKDDSMFVKNSYDIFLTLVNPFLADLKGNKLIIIPDGPLWHINFDLLLTSNKSTEDYKELDYLLKDYAISYAYSANLLLQESNRQNEFIAKQPLLAFSFSDSDNTGDKIALRTLRNHTTKDLPGSRDEVRAIADIYDGQYFYGKLASEANFKANAQKYSILHLALHGEIDNTYPNNSKLYFTQNTDTIEDGYLYAYELYNMTLNADLAVLSACNTGAGKLMKGEGIMSLGRAFTYAGCKSLVLTQWEVSDATTPKIMKYFYQGLKDGLRKDEALRQAKLNYLATADKLSASPFYWGSFVLLGDASEIEFHEDYKNLIYGSIILLLVIIIVMIVRTKKLKLRANPTL